ncbi:hypothetical protein BN1723_012405 [Verticillium longisporum]|uniref:Uncharacterized protein n=1 Tax=Verticillium longisporum TaxID=100787 RepID=A0A0G4LHF3_VERLO|nr:hypothetical protein BN1723_012405 [Verticillium longisporum]
MLLAVVAAVSSAQQDLFKYMDELPDCAVFNIFLKITCILQEVPRSTCNIVMNSACLCTDEPLRKATQACVKSSCESMLDALKASKLEADACQRPHRDRRSSLLSSIPVQVITVLVIALRMVSRWRMSHSFEPDDWIMTACLILYVPFCFIGTYVGRLAFGRDIWTVEPDDLTYALKLLYIAQTLYMLCLALPKIAILTFFLRIFPSQGFRRATYLVIGLIGLSTTITTFLQIFQCTPIRFNWEGWKGQFGQHHCMNLNALAFACAGLSILQDLIVLVLPLPQLLRLNVSRRTKAGVIFMFSLGIFILVTSCIRLRYIIVFARSSNPTWDYVDALIWSGTEISVSMIVVSLPAIRLLLSKIVPGLFSTIASRTGWSFKTTRQTDGQNQSSQRFSRRDALRPEAAESEHPQNDLEKCQSQGSYKPLRPLSKVLSSGLYDFNNTSGPDFGGSEEALELGERIK